MYPTVMDATFTFKFDTKDDALKASDILAERPKTCRILEDLNRGLVLTIGGYPHILSKIEELDPSDETQIRDRISKSQLFISVDEGLEYLRGSIKSLNSMLDPDNKCPYYIDVDLGTNTIKVETIQDNSSRIQSEVERVLNRIKQYT